MESRPRNLPADERRAVTVATVIQLAAEQNPGEITTAAIAARMGLTQGALFRHFPSKDALWQAVMECVARRLLDRAERAARDAVSPLAALEAMYFAHIDFVAAHPGVPRMLFGELQRAGDTGAKRAVQHLIGRYREELVVLLERGKAQGELADVLDTQAAAILFIGMIQGLVMQSMVAGKVALIRDEAPGAFAIYRRGIASAT
ncbi:MAG TPA: TetR/AcrR family transcriptional regulator [Burkholderiaceae bacterium]|nr:TetR/AcrR family transcriptional regulator [Burkholderiaceae bacterium]